MVKEIQNVVAIIYDGDEFLIMKRKLLYVAWQFVQGGIEAGESEEKALKREIWEETGLKNFEIVKKVNASNDYKFELNGVQYHKFQNYFLVKADKNEKVVLSNEHSDYKWCKFEEALQDIKFNKEQFKTAYEEVKKL